MTIERRPNILFVNPSSIMGGSERSLLTLIDVTEGKIRASVMCLRGGHFETALAQRKVPIYELGDITFKSRVSPLGVFRVIQRIRAAIRASNADVVVANLEGKTLHAYIAASLERVPFYYVERFNFGLKAGFAKRWWVRKSDGVVFVSSRQADDFLAQFRKSQEINYKVLYNPIRIPALDLSGHATRAMIDIDLAAPLIGVFGRITRDKGLEFLPRIISGVVFRFPSAKFIVVGQASSVDDEDYLQAIRTECRNLHIEDSITFLGHREDVYELMAACDVTLLPSKSESFGRVALESWAVRTPVVSSDMPVTREIFGAGRGGILVEYGNIQDYVRAICSLLESDSDRESLGELGFRWVGENCDPMQYAKSYLKFIGF